MGMMLLLEEDVELVVVCPSLISMVRKVFMSVSASPWVTCCPLSLPGVSSSFESLKTGTSFSAGTLVPPKEFCDWPVKDRCGVAPPLGKVVAWLCDAADVTDEEPPEEFRDATVCVNFPAALEKLVWPVMPEVVPILSGAFFNGGTFVLWLDSVNFRIRSRTELVLLIRVSIASFFSGPSKTTNKLEAEIGTEKALWIIRVKDNMDHLHSLQIPFCFLSSI